MELRWWWLVAAGLVALVVIVVAAFFWPVRAQPRSLRPLAWVGRLTELPEYARAYRIYRILLAAIAVSTIAVLLCAIVATARPVSSQATNAEINRVHPQDVMLCLQDDPASHDISVALSYFRDKAATFDTQRLGLTTRTLRVIPLTRDYAFLQERLGRYADLQRLAAGKDLGPDESAALARARSDFGRTVAYSDYRLTVNDAIAMCLKGFAGKASDARRSVIYLGPAGPSTAPIYSDDALVAMARESGIQLNVLTPTAVDAGGGVSRVAAATGGRFISYVVAADAKEQHPDRSAMDNALRAHLDDIWAHPPAPRSSDGSILVQQVRDRPNTVLTIALGLVIVFSVSLAGVRR